MSHVTFTIKNVTQTMSAAALWALRLLQRFACAGMTTISTALVIRVCPHLLTVAGAGTSHIVIHMPTCSV